ncbi:hypothetical protein G6053_13490 [Sphingobacterium sp. DR205]|nr:hypothetical protein G6053_13490 [Sphingobacterium sp. DR205]
MQNKQNEAIAELKEWVQNPISIEDYTTYGVAKIEEKLNEVKVPKSILNGFESLDNWYTNHFVYEMLVDGKSEYRETAAANGYHILFLTNKFAELYPGNPPSLSFDRATYWLANCLLQNWYNETEILIRMINNAFSTDVLEGGWEIKSASWFIVEMVNRGFNIESDLSGFNYPEDMGDYQAAIENWNTNDLQLVDHIVTKLCDFHLENATYEDEETSPEIQFGDSAWFVYAFEILTWLAVRKKIGLENPKEFTHPLMRLNINQLQKLKFEFPESDLFTKVLTKLGYLLSTNWENGSSRK